MSKEDIFEREVFRAPVDEIFNTVRSATAALYPEARIPERPKSHRVLYPALPPERPLYPDQPGYQKPEARIPETVMPETELDAVYDALNGLLSVIDRVLFNKPTRADYAKIEAAHQLVRERAAKARGEP